MATSVLITGASGLIGSRLTDLLLDRGFRVSHLGRSRSQGSVPKFVWDVSQGTMDADALQGIDVIVHLAGAGVADKRWTKHRKKEILESRTASSDLLYEALKKQNHAVKAVVSASAIGYYGFGFDADFRTETDGPGTDFLAQVVVAWERAVDKLGETGCRLTKIRIGIVLSKEGGALVEMSRPVRWGVGAPLGSGVQDISWIHLDDLCEIFIRAIQDESMKGIYNAVSPHPMTNADLTRRMAKVLRRPLWLPPVPGWVVGLLLGEMGEMVLQGSRVSADKLLKSGFRFRFENVDDALRDLLH